MVSCLGTGIYYIKNNIKILKKWRCVTVRQRIADSSRWNYLQFAAAYA